MSVSLLARARRNVADAWWSVVRMAERREAVGLAPAERAPRGAEHDQSGFADVEREEVERLWRTPAFLRLQDVAVRFAQRGVGHVDHGPVELHVSGSAARVALDAVDGDPRVTE